MSEARAFKDLVYKINEELYNNLSLLKCTYKTSQEFDRVFKKDIFIKNNKKAFYEVIYYLLNVLNPELTKEMLKTWPPYDIKGENKFRNELLNYIKELNQLYRHANIPSIMLSHLISPGGFKFSRFMLKISQLVVYEHLNKNSAGLLLYCPVPNKNNNLTNGILNDFKRITLESEMRTNKIIKKFQEYQNTQKISATMLVANLTELDQNILASKKLQTAAEEEFYKKYTLYPSITILKEKIFTLKQQWNNLSEIHMIFEKCKDTLKYLSSHKLVIEHNLSTQTNNNLQENKLDLCEFFNSFVSLINDKSLELPNPSSSYIQLSSEKLSDITNKYLQQQRDINNIRQHTDISIKKMFEILIYVDNLVPYQE